jgi:hypothetical protein
MQPMPTFFQAWIGNRFPNLSHAKILVLRSKQQFSKKQQ